MTDKVHVCAHCGIHFMNPDDWSDEEALAEFNKEFPDHEGPKDVICEDCYQIMMGKKTKNSIDYLH